jgi:DNA-binding NarL/FixJ family response regulator
MKKTRILLADDHDLIRRGLRPLLEAEWGWEICGEAVNGRQAVEMAAKLTPDVVVLDVGMPELNGIEATRQIKMARPATEVLILTGQENDELVHRILAAGARGYMRKSDAGTQIVPAIKALCEHKPYLTSRAAEIILNGYLTGDRADEQVVTGGLTPREREIVQLLGEGKSNKDVGSLLSISVKTAETHRATIMRKLGFSAFSELVRYAVRNNIIQG